MKITPLLKELSEIHGVTGDETAARELIESLWTPWVDEIQTDKMGSLIALKRGRGEEPRPRLMLAAHMDEIGLMVTGIEKGFLRVTRVGGTDARAILGSRVIVHGKQELPGIVATRPPHVLPAEARKKAVPWDKIFVDVGLPEKEVKRQVSIGDLIVMDQQLVELKNGRVSGKAFDDRACVAVLTLALEQLAQIKHPWDVIAVATVQEEIGLKGAITAAYGVAPDLAIALDVTFAKQSDLSDNDVNDLSKGPTLGLGPNFHPHLFKRLKKVAGDHEIPYQIEPVPGRHGTDAWAIQVTHEGVPTALISVPVRYMHQTVELLDTKDIERAARWLSAFITNLEMDYLEHLGWDDDPAESND